MFIMRVPIYAFVDLNIIHLLNEVNLNSDYHQLFDFESLDLSPQSLHNMPQNDPAQ